MLALVSGEGPSDMGSCIAGAENCHGNAFSPGPIALLVDKLLQGPWGYSPLDSGSVISAPKAFLTQLSKSAMVPTLPGKKKRQETGYFFKNAYALANHAKALETERDCSVLAVLFRDCDGTRSAAKGIWNEKRSSMEQGFAAAGFSRGVPMIPKPTSEVWLLCALQPHPYQNCARLEAVSGNDSSPNSAKKQFDQALDARSKSKDDINHLIITGKISPDEIDMPSFNSFRERLLAVATSMVGGA
jgi:hypothetical protein